MHVLLGAVSSDDFYGNPDGIVGNSVGGMRCYNIVGCIFTMCRNALDSVRHSTRVYGVPSFLKLVSYA